MKQEHVGSSTGRGNTRDNTMVARLEKQLSAAQRRCDSLQSQLAKKALAPKGSAAKQKTQEEAAHRAKVEDLEAARDELEARVLDLGSDLRRVESEKGALLDYVQEAEAAKTRHETQMTRMKEAAETAGYKAAAHEKSKTKAAEAEAAQLRDELKALEARVRYTEGVSDPDRP